MDTMAEKVVWKHKDTVSGLDILDSTCLHLLACH